MSDIRYETDVEYNEERQKQIDRFIKNSDEIEAVLAEMKKEVDIAGKEEEV